MTYSKHYVEDRTERQALIETIGGIGNTIYTKIQADVKRKRIYRYEITDNAILLVKSMDGAKLVTMMVARPSRITRYWADAPEWLIMKSVEYTKKGYYI